MSELTQNTTTLPLRAAVEAHDVDAAVQAFAPNAVLHSPITDRLTFEGHAEIRALFEVLLEVFQGIVYTDEIRGEDSAVLLLKARVDGAEVEVTDHMRLDEQGRISELTVFFRPMPVIPVTARALGAGLSRRKSSARGALVSFLVRPLILLSRVGDVIAVRLVRPALR